MRDHTLHIRVRNEEWAALFSSRTPMLQRLEWGKCDHDLRVFAVRASLRGVDAVDTAIHEFTHAYFPDIAEESVNEFSTQLAEFLMAANMIDADWTRKDLE
jgi:hypothetical protein